MQNKNTTETITTLLDSPGEATVTRGVRMGDGVRGAVLMCVGTVAGQRAAQTLSGVPLWLVLDDRLTVTRTGSQHVQSVHTAVAIGQ